MLLLAAAWADDPTLTYTFRDGAARGDLSAYTFTRFEANETLFVVGPDAYLKAEGKYDSKSGRKLAIGTRVKLLGAGEGVEEVGGRVDTWYRVEVESGASWIHGSKLSPFGWRVDIDGDDEMEFVGVTFGADFNVRTVVAEPNPKVAAEVWIDADSVGGAYVGVKGSTITAKLLNGRAAGITLVNVHTGVEACADYADYWISYRTDAPGRTGIPRIALALTGLADPPTLASYAVKFDGKRGLADVTRTNQSEDENGKVSKTVETTRYVLVNGEFKAEAGGKIER